MTYSSEAFCHQKLDLYLTQEEAEDNYVIEIKRSDTPICKARVEFAVS